jgi:HlyD family secretion protein
MKKGFVGLFAVAAIALIIYLAVGQGDFLGLGNLFNPGAANSTPTPASTPLAPVKASNQINVEGKLVPYQHGNLGFNTSGTVETIEVKEGALVKAGQVLARLRNQEQIRVAIASAQLELADAQKALDDLNTNAPLVASQLHYDIIQAEKEFVDAQKKRTALDYPRADEKLIKEAQSRMEKAEDDFKNIEDVYNAASELGKRDYIDMLQQARKARDDARATYYFLKGTPDQYAFNQADARLELAQTKLADLQRKYEIYKNGADPAEVELIQAQMEQAQAKLEAAQADLVNLEIRAPFDGTIVSLNLKVGQYVNPGEVAVTMADFSRWRVETTNLTELSVMQIHEGSLATVWLDALPGVTFPGKVAYIKNFGENKQGEITFTTIIDLDQADPRLRWYMTAPVVIETQ